MNSVDIILKTLSLLKNKIESKIQFKSFVYEKIEDYMFISDSCDDIIYASCKPTTEVLDHKITIEYFKNKEVRIWIDNTSSGMILFDRDNVTTIDTEKDDELFSMVLNDVDLSFIYNLEQKLSSFENTAIIINIDYLTSDVIKDMNDSVLNH